MSAADYTPSQTGRTRFEVARTMLELPMLSETVPLARYPIFRTTDPVMAAERARTLFCPHRITEIDEPRHFRARQQGVNLRSLSISVLSYHCGVRLRTTELRDRYLILIPLGGAAEINVDGESLAVYPTLGCVVGACGPVRMGWSANCLMLVVRVERGALEAELRERIGGTGPVPIRFESAMDFASGLRAGWWRQLTHLVEDLDADSALPRHPLCVGGLESGLMLGLLVAQPHNHSERLRAAHPAIGEHRIMRAVAILEREPQRPWTTAGLAREAGIGVRALYTDFRRVLDTSPMAYLRNVRLRRVHRELRQPSRNTGVTVAKVATTWGFSHLGEFAAAYRRFYGENPSATLRRAEAATRVIV